MKDISEIPEGLLVSQIRNRLEKRFGRLPQKGVVAGQAVASAVYEMLGLTKNAPYNDVDIFCLDHQYPNYSLEKDINDKSVMNKVGKPKRTVLGLVGSFGGSPIPMEIGETGYSVLDTVYDINNNEHNYIKINTNYSVGDDNDEIKSHINTVLEGFDINCCQIGFDLEKGVVHWTPEFKNFLYQKEIKTAYFGTPMHTAVRLLKKDDDIDFATLDVPVEMRKIQTMRAIINHYEDMKESGRQFFPGNMMSNIYLRRVQAREEVLSKYFNIISKKCTFKNLEPVTYKSVDVSRDMYFLESKDCCEDTLNFFTNKIKELNILRIDSFIPYFERSYDLFNTPGKKNKQVVDAANRISGMKGEFFAKNIFIRNAMHEEGFSVAGFKDEYIQRYLKMMGKHPQLFHHASNLKTTEAMKLAESVRWLEKHNMNYVVGEIESLIYLYGRNFNIEEVKAKKLNSERKSEVVSAETVFSIECLLDKGFKEKAKKAHDRKLDAIRGDCVEPKFSKVCESLSKGSVAVKEITNHLDLFYEGENMHHCVGGYWDRVESNHSFIFHLDIEVDGDIQSSTLEIFPGFDREKDKKGLVISQNYGVGNNSVSTELSELAGFIKDKANEQIDEIRKSLDIDNFDFKSLTFEDFKKYHPLERIVIVDFDIYQMENNKNFQRFLQEKLDPEAFKRDELPF